MQNRRLYLKVVAWVVVLLLIWFFTETADIQALLAFVRAQGGLGGAITFVAVYVLATVAFVPGVLLTLWAGVAFGVPMGSAVVSVGSTLGATCAFLIGRYLARHWMSQKIAGNRKLRFLDNAVAESGFKIVLLIRLSPILPFGLVNYALGLTKVRLKDYIVASWIGMAPATVMYVYLGAFASRITATDAPLMTPQFLYGVVGLLTTVVVSIYLARMARAALRLDAGP